MFKQNKRKKAINEGKGRVDLQVYYILKGPQAPIANSTEHQIKNPTTLRGSQT